MELTQEILHELLDYDPSTGVLTWKERDPKWFVNKPERADKDARGWNKNYAGKEAFTASDKASMTGTIFRRSYKKHRVIWLWMTGKWPVEHIDHKDGNFRNNRFENLREATHEQNCRNKRKLDSNKSGKTGVAWNSSHRTWQVQISDKGKKQIHGHFHCLGLAIKKRIELEIQFGYDPNHGKTRVFND